MPLKALLSSHVCVEVVAVLYHLLRFDAYDAENEVVDVAEQVVPSSTEV
jgi:hypothetical protein